MTLVQRALKVCLLSSVFFAAVVLGYLIQDSAKLSATQLNEKPNKCLNCREKVETSGCEWIRSDLQADGEDIYSCRNVREIAWHNARIIGPVEVLWRGSDLGQNRLQKGFSLQGAAGTYAEYQGEYIQVTPLLFNEDTNMGLSAFPKVLSEVRREIGSAYFYWNESEILAQLPRILASNRLPPAVGIRILEQRAWRGCQLESEDRFEITSENLHLFSKTNGIFRIPTPIPSRVCGSP